MVKQRWNDPEAVAQMRRTPLTNVDTLKEEHIAKGLYRVPDTSALYRIADQEEHAAIVSMLEVAGETTWIFRLMYTRSGKRRGTWPACQRIDICGRLILTG